MVALMKPQPGEHVHDPAAGTIGFLEAADRFIKEHSDQLFDLSADLQEFQKNQACTGMELVPDTHRLALMNALQHDIYSPILLSDTLSGDGQWLKDADLVLWNPPFGTKKGGGSMNIEHRSEDGQGAAISESPCPWQADDERLGSSHRHLMGFGGSESAAPWDTATFGVHYAIT